MIRQIISGKKNGDENEKGKSKIVYFLLYASSYCVAKFQENTVVILNVVTANIITRSNSYFPDRVFCAA